MAIFSRNLSVCCACLSVWGIIQLVVMGVLFTNKAVAFSEDLGIEIEHNEPRNFEEFYGDVNRKYNYSANNCWVAAGIYALVFLLSLQQFYSSRK